MVTMLDGVHAPPRQIRFVHSQGQPPAKRRRINAACLTCRRRKTRCFGERPVCSTCTKNNHPCQGYSDEADKKPYEEGRLGDENEDMFGRTSANKNHSNDGRDERRHSKSKLSAARPFSSTAGGPPLIRRDADAGLRRTTAHRFPRSSPWDEATRRRQQYEEFDNASAPFEENAGAMTRSRHGRNSKACSVSYIRYFGPTAIMPGFRKVVVSVKSRCRSSATGLFSESSPAPTLGPPGAEFTDHIESEALPAADGLPVYDLSDTGPVPPLIRDLVQAFFVHLGSNYPFLKPERFYKLLNEKSVEPILVNAVCALAARFSDSSVFDRGGDGRARSGYGQFYAQRAKAATVDTFACPSIGAVQAFLLMACDGFGASQDSSLWMYLGLAIRMANDLGLHKVVDIKCQGGGNPWFSRHRDDQTVADASPDDDGFELEAGKTTENSLSADEQKEFEQERVNTLWAVFTLDRVVSSATGRPVTFRYDDFDISLPEPSLDPSTAWPDPYPHFVRIMHLYGRVLDVMNSINNIKEFTDEKRNKLAAIEAELTKQHQALDQRLEFNTENFKAHVAAGKATTFVLFHFWFHALIIVLHHPTLLPPLVGLSHSHQLLSNSRELSMSSAKAITDILAFAELIDPKSLLGNPFTSQPMYIAACAFLAESAGNASKPASPAATPPETDPGPSRPHGERKPGDSRSASNTHSLLASTANQNYQRCYDALVELRKYWGGVGYMLAALDQKSAGAWDVKAFARGEYAGRGGARVGLAVTALDAPRSSSVQSAAVWSLVGTADAPGSSNLSLLYPDMESGSAALKSGGHLPPASIDESAEIQRDAARQGQYPQRTTSAPRLAQRQRRPATETQTPTRARRALEHMPPGDTITPPPSVDRAPGYAVAMPQPYTPSSHSPAGYGPATMQGASPAAAGHRTGAVGRGGTDGDGRPHQQFVDGYRGMYTQDVMAFDGQGMGMGMGGMAMQGEVMPGWMAYLPGMDMYDGMGG